MSAVTIQKHYKGKVSVFQISEAVTDLKLSIISHETIDNLDRDEDSKAVFDSSS